MNAELILRDTCARGIVLTVYGNRLDVEARGTLLTDELLANLKAHKTDLLALLASRCGTCAGPVEVASGNDWRHTWCPAGHFDRWEAASGKTLRETAGKAFPDLFNRNAGGAGRLYRSDGR